MWSKILLRTGIGVGTASAVVANRRAQDYETCGFLFSFHKYLMLAELLLVLFSINLTF